MALLLLDLPCALCTPTGCWRLFRFVCDGGAYFGSLWYGLQLLGVRIGQVNFFALLFFFVGAAAFAYFYFQTKEVPEFATMAFLIVAVFTSSSKVYSPQYVVWLTPLAVLAIRDKSLRKDFWIWQAGEMIYHLAVWEYLASYTGAHFGLPARGYALSIFIRLATTIWFASRLIKTSSTPKFQPQEPEFLSIAADGYA